MPEARIDDDAFSFHTGSERQICSCLEKLFDSGNDIVILPVFDGCSRCWVLGMHQHEIDAGFRCDSEDFRITAPGRDVINHGYACCNGLARHFGFVGIDAKPSLRIFLLDRFDDIDCSKEFFL